MSQLIDNIYYSDDMKTVRGADRAITTAVIKDGVTCIYWDAFAWCSNLQSVVLPDSVVKIDYGAFSSCENLQSIVISKNLVSIGKYSFSSCENLTKLDLPDTLTSIDKDAFAGCKKLKEVHFGGNIEKLSGQLFDTCPEVELYAPAKSLTEKAIKKNAKLKLLYKKSGDTQIVSVDSFLNDMKKNYPSFEFSMVFTGKTDQVVFIKGGKNVSVIQLSSDISSQGENFKKFLSVFCDETKTNEEIVEAFTTNEIKTVAIKKEFLIPQIKTDEMNLFIDEIQKMSKSFLSASRVKKITFGRKASIGKNAFYECKDLQNIILPENITKIEDGTFENCSNLQSVVIPESVTSIGVHAFCGCRNLQSIGIPSGVTSIGRGAFEDCTNLQSVVIPESVTSIGSYAFTGCENVQDVTIPDGVTEIGDAAFKGCKIENYDHALFNVKNGLCLSADEKKVLYCANFAIKEAIIPEGVTSIAGLAFNHGYFGCRNLQSVVIPETVTEIGLKAFEESSIKEIHITNLVAWFENHFEQVAINRNADLYLNGELVDFTNLVIPEGVTKIEWDAFNGCKKLKSVVIPDSVTAIKDRAFCGCENLKSIIIPDSVTSIGSWAFRFDDNLTITFKGTEDSWKKIKGVKDVESDLGDNQIKFTR